MNYPKLITAPANEPVTAAWLADHLRFDIGDEDTSIEGYIKATRDYWERRSDTIFITSTYEEAVDCWWSDPYELYFWPVQEIASIIYTKEDGGASADIKDRFDLDTYNDPARLVLKDGQDFPNDLGVGINMIKIQYKAGYGDDETDVPEAIRQAIRLRASLFFSDRVDSSVNVAVFERQADILMFPFLRMKL